MVRSSSKNLSEKSTVGGEEFWRKPPTETLDLPTTRRGQVASALDYMHSRGVIHCDLNLAHDDILLGPGVKTKTHHMFDLDVEVINWGTVYNKNYLYKFK